MGEYSAHLVEKHRGKLEYKCEEERCGKVLGTWLGFTSHMMFHNEDKKRFVCSVCQKCFLYDSFLKVYVQTKDFLCLLCTCGKIFKSQQSLKTHMELHSRERYPCKEPGLWKHLLWNIITMTMLICSMVIPISVNEYSMGVISQTHARTTLHWHEDFFCKYKTRRGLGLVWLEISSVFDIVVAIILPTKVAFILHAFSAVALWITCISYYSSFFKSGLILYLTHQSYSCITCI